MSSSPTRWPSSKASRVFAAILKIGWTVKRTVAKRGSHVVLERPGFSNYVWAFHDGDEIGPPMMSRIAKATGLTPEDL